MNTILLISSALLLGLLSLIFLYIFIKVIGLIGNNNESNKGLSEEQLNQKLVEQFNMGFNRGVTIAQMSLYKMWVEGGETVIVGSYDNVKTEMNNNFNQFFNSIEILKEWNNKFETYVNQTKDTTK